MSVLKRYYNTIRIDRRNKHKIPFYQGTFFRYAPKNSFNTFGTLAGLLRHTKHVDLLDPLTHIKRPLQKKQKPFVNDDNDDYQPIKLIKVRR